MHERVFLANLRTVGLRVSASIDRWRLISKSHYGEYKLEDNKWFEKNDHACCMRYQFNGNSRHD
ncbi:hypothetical protein KIN20_018703 [Parelaphostrongylus tenuis]|uniref:Uncharacterized protein n=1 Tax=Parelaphostrongylus tenuis TaxID=148309 RepID=A0AAD5MJY8_PARTN|nr:hypothetical protein KIN20_018703 [Parelaphostrongylus tenuis]